MFKDLRKYLKSLLSLSKPIEGEQLYIYLFVSSFAISLVLIQDDAGVQRLIYYMSKVLRDAKTKYAKMEKLVYIIIFFDLISIPFSYELTKY